MNGKSATFVVFFVALVLAWFLIGTKFTFTNDEGIYLEGARSVLAGKVLYKDHFAFTGPGCYWITAACFRLFGETVAASRVPLVIGLAATSAAVFSLLGKLVSQRAGCFAAGVFFAIAISNPSMQSVNHRWDSSALACIAALLIYRASSRWAILAGGVCAAGAAWVTPSVLIFGVVLAVWMWRRAQLLPFLAGGALCSVFALTALAATGSLPYLLPSLLWASAHYSEANTVGYGSVNGGIARLFENSNPIAMLVAAVILVGILAPAAAPLLNLIRFRTLSAELTWLAAASFALVVSTYPRMDAGHLTNVFALPLVIAAYLISQLEYRRWIASVVGVSSALLLFYAASSRIDTVEGSTPAGVIHASSKDMQSILFAQRNVPSGRSLFVYPYMPVFYFLTGGLNPTPYSFLQPGMMTTQDESNALAHLQTAPPEYILFCRPPLEDLLRIWPNTDPARVRMPALEGWIEANYRIVDAAQPSLLGYRLMRTRNLKLESKLDPLP